MNKPEPISDWIPNRNEGYEEPPLPGNVVVYIREGDHELPSARPVYGWFWGAVTHYKIVRLR